MLKKVSAVVLGLGLAVNCLADSKVVYGEDDRLDLTEVTEQAIVDYAKATATQIRRSNITKMGDQVKLSFTSLQNNMGVCSDERFANENAIGRCSGFLVAPDVLVTAGHCMQGNDCSEYQWVFGYDNEEAADNLLPADKVYNCKEVLTSQLNTILKIDYAVVKLDRPVYGVTPLKVRTSGAVDKYDPLVIIGSPSGLPTKVTSNVYVKKDDHPQYFVTNADTFGGNSGSATINPKTGVVEGILVRGAKDYKFNVEKMCMEVNVCESYNANWGCGGESISKITAVGLEQFL